MYASAIFYSIRRVPPKVLPLVLGNPLAVIIDEARNALLWGLSPNWVPYGIILAVSFALMIFEVKAQRISVPGKVFFTAASI